MHWLFSYVWPQNFPLSIYRFPDFNASHSQHSTLFFVLLISVAALIASIENDHFDLWLPGVLARESGHIVGSPVHAGASALQIRLMNRFIKGAANDGEREFQLFLPCRCEFQSRQNQKFSDALVYMRASCTS